MKKQYLTKVVSLLLLVAFLPLMPSCTDDEVATGAAAVAVGSTIIAIGAAVDANDHDGPRRPHRPRRPRYDRCGRGYKEVCRPYRDYYGRYIDNCRCIRVRRPYRPYGILEDYIAVDETLTAEDYSIAYYMSVESGARVKDAIDRANEGKLDGMKEIGFTKKAIDKIAQLRLPSQEEFDAVAKNLNQDVIFTRSMISKMIMFARDERQKTCEEDKLDFPYCG